MASITLTSITRANIGRNEVKVSGTINLTDVKGVTGLQLSLASPAAILTNISVNTTSFSGTVIGLTGGQKYEIKLTLTYSYEYVKSCSFKYNWNPEDPESKTYIYTTEDPDNAQLAHDTITSMGGWASVITTVKDEGEESINSNPNTIYTKPEEFKFATDMGTDTKWEVSKGIQTILPNIYTFNNVATKWLNWYNQLESTPCTVFQKGKLSAAMLNSAYSYLQVTKSYQPGDKVAQSMFTGLENILNGE